MKKVTSDTKTVYRQFHDSFARYGDGLYYYVLQLTGDETLAKEMVQECFLRLWKSRQTIAPGADLLPRLVAFISAQLEDMTDELILPKR